MYLFFPFFLTQPGIEPGHPRTLFPDDVIRNTIGHLGHPIYVVKEVLCLVGGVGLCFLQARVHRPIIYLNRKRDLNDIYIIVTVYQYFRNYSISQLVTDLPTARVYEDIPIAMIYAVQGYMSVLRNIEVSINQTLVKYVHLQATIGTLYLCPHNRDVRISAEIWRLKRAFGGKNIIDIAITTYATTMNVEKWLLLITAFFNATAIYDSLRERQTSSLVSILIIFY